MPLKKAVLQPRPFTFASGTARVWWGAHTATQSSKVLVIDDDRALANMVAFIFRQFGFEPSVANSGDDGIVLAKTQAPDAIVLDLRMPGKDGRTVYRELREAGVEAPVLILSAYDARQARDELGAQAFLNKPFEPEELVEAVRNMLTSKQG